MSKISVIPLFAIIILAVGLMNHVIVIPLLLDKAQRDSWLSVLIVFPLFMIWIGLLFYIIRKTKQQPIIEWIEQRYGSFTGFLFRVVFILFFVSINLMTLKDTTTWTDIFYLPATPTWVIASSMTLLCFFAAKFGIRAIGITSGILLPFVVIFGDFVMSANLPKKDYSILMPMFENGIQPAIQGMTFVGGGLVELIILLCIHQHIASKIRLSHLIVLGCILVILILGPLTGSIAEFGPFEAAKQRYPAYEEWRLVTIGRYIQHVDFLSMYQWLAGSFIRISITMLLFVELLGIRTQKNRNTALILTAAGMIIFTQLPISDMRFMQFLSAVYFPVSLWTMLSVSCLLFILVMIKSKAKEV
ncbi:GerAB/ArcD/ProY family transporter [Paenibacillus eucommiae]|uniref:Spore germination protein (Amino acid permease) n=1 Tax=Paenibacillus eucommiae TaxID=1355755 RepID=A0ABS4IQV9_9BACL|nr:endospore germination permease [Paenibacillus eucommiae]MBP1989959.1 spore germination protein (amino acid permease) [Paenibacillus eucommiae]